MSEHTANVRQQRHHLHCHATPPSSLSFSCQRLRLLLLLRAQSAAERRTKRATLSVSTPGTLASKSSSHHSLANGLQHSLPDVLLLMRAQAGSSTSLR